MQSQERTKNTTETSVVTLPGLKFAEADDTFPYRVVGSYEYGKSLDSFGKLVGASTAEEVEVYDKLIAENPEYSFHSGVVSEHGLDAKIDSLSGSSGEDMDAKYLKKSLAWMMALARSELGATVSMYGKLPDPYGFVVGLGGQNFGAEEFLRLLVDDLATHLKAVERDADFQSALKRSKKVDESSLAYLRRVKLIRDLLAKVMSSGNPEIVMLAKPYAETAKRYEKKLAGKVQYATSDPLSFKITKESSETQKRNLTTREVTGQRPPRQTSGTKGR